MAESHPTDRPLTRNQGLVFDALAGAEAPLSAYTILDKLRDDGLRAPLQVYRALDTLIERGLVHRLESLNAFVACRHPECEDAHVLAFTICDGCGTVEELSDRTLERRLRTLVDDQRFSLTASTVELRGRCNACQIG